MNRYTGVLVVSFRDLCPYRRSHTIHYWQTVNSLINQSIFEEKIALNSTVLNVQLWLFEVPPCLQKCVVETSNAYAVSNYSNYHGTL